MHRSSKRSSAVSVRQSPALLHWPGGTTVAIARPNATRTTAAIHDRFVTAHVRQRFQ